jgi:hypothetical protein
MANFSWLNKGTLITLEDGSQKAIEEIAAGDKIQTYDGSAEDFDSAHIEHNEQTSGAVTEVEENSIESVDVSKISFSNDTNLILSSDSPIHGMKTGTNWVAASKDAAEELYGAGERTEADIEADAPESRFTELAADDSVFVDDGEGLSYDVSVTEIESQKDEDDFTMYCISELDKGGTFFANGVLLGLGVD